MKFTVRTRLSISFALIFTILIILFSGVIYYLMVSDLERELVEDSKQNMYEVLLVFTSGTWETQLAEMPEESREFNLSIKVLDLQGNIAFLTEGVSQADWPVEKDLLQQALEKPVWSNEEINGVSHLVLTQSFVAAEGKPPHFIQIANSRAHINKVRNLLMSCVNVGTPLILAIAVIAGRFFAKRALAPVDRIRARAQTIKSDSLHERLEYSGPPDELFRLTETLNDLLDRVEQSVNLMKQFVADASHELRIPLTGLRGTVEVALRQVRSNDEYKKILETVYNKSERLSELVWDLLSLAQVDSGKMELEKMEVEIEPFLTNLLEEAKALDSEKRVAIRLGKVAKGKAKFDEVKVHLLLVNLLENAVRYNKPGGEVLLSSELNSRFIVSVKDTGIGIPNEDQPKIFDRFYRVDKARSREAGGTGLGLAIARSIAEAHNGTLKVRSVFSEGSEFTLTLPLS